MKPLADAHGVVVPFVDHLGLRLIDWRDGIAALTYDPMLEHENNFKAVHGGVVMTLLDVAMARAGRSVRPEQGLVTVKMKTSFMRPARGPLVGRGTCCT